MKCPSCQATTPSGQKFCGSCGHKLESECVQCGKLNPPGYKFCGDCGASLTMDTAISLARSGLITQVDHKAAKLLGLRQNEMIGKPFSLFIDRMDMVIFFSHWNELLSSTKKQTFELALKHKSNDAVYVGLECRVSNRSSGNTGEYLVVINQVTEDRMVSAQLQYQQDLLGLIFTTTDNISSVTSKHFDQSLENALKNLCLFTQSDWCFVYNVNRIDRCLELAYQWSQPSSSAHNGNGQSESIPLRKIKRTMARFLKEQAYIVNDVPKLSRAERDELQNWHQAEFGAVMCHLVRSGSQPIAIIGLAKIDAEDEWTPDCVALVKFMGQIFSDKLPITGLEVQTADDADRPTEEAHEKIEKVFKEDPDKALDKTPDKAPDKAPDKTPDKTIDATPPPADSPATAEATEPDAAIIRPKSQPRNLLDMSQPMRLEEISETKPETQETVFIRDDGLVLLTCPSCSHQESISMGWFEKLGNAISVTCPCKKLFAAVLEKRRAHRKSVKLEGYFTLKSDLETNATDSSIWGPMVVTDLSKSGLRFTSDRADLVYADDLLMVRFNLDNTNQALINKPARVISTSGNQVGCQFEGDDSYDITLGFYFL